MIRLVTPLKAIVLAVQAFAIARVYPAPVRTTLWKTLVLVALTFVLDTPLTIRLT